MKRFNQLTAIAIITTLLAFRMQTTSGVASEPVLKHATKLFSQLPADIKTAHQQYDAVRWQYDSLDHLLKKAFVELANKVDKKSAKLNDMAGISVENASYTFIPANQKFSDYFRMEWDKMDALEKTFNQNVKPFYGKEEYKVQGYVPAWDSVYKYRLPHLIKYRDGVLKLVQAEIAYLKANEKIFTNGSSEEKLQYAESELSILQKIHLLRDKYTRLVTRDGVEKVQFCIDNPQACPAPTKN